MLRDPEVAAGVRRWATAGAPPDADKASSVIGATVPGLALGTRAREAGALLDGCVGLGPLAGVVEDPCVTDVLVNADGSVWVDSGTGPCRAPTADLPGPEGVRRLAVRLAGLAGQRLDDSQPWVDGELPGSIRLHAVLPPVAADGAHISLRVPSRTPWTLPRLVATGMLGDATAELLADLVHARRTLLVSGATGAGKTALLCALLDAVPPEERVVVVEDVREIRSPRPQVVALQGRSANVEGVGSVSLSQLVRQALRMRADRIVVGEARGAEVVDLLTALNTGHAGLGTIHANSAADVPARCVALGGLAGQSPRAVLRQLSTAVDVVVHVARRDGRRRVVEIGVVEGQRVVTALTLEPGAGPRVGSAAELLERLRARCPGSPPAGPSGPPAARVLPECGGAT
jgi:pilus assembly protein CpaF